MVDIIPTDTHQFVENAVIPDLIPYTEGEYLVTPLINSGEIRELLPVQPPLLTWSNAPEQYFWLDVGPFTDRFGDDWPVIASSTDRECVAFMNAVINNRKYINIKDPRVAGAIDMLIATNKPTTWALFPTSSPMDAVKKARILDYHTTEYERHIKGLPQPSGE